MVKIDRQTRLNAFNLLNELKEKGFSQEKTINKIQEKFNLPYQTIYGWYKKNSSPYGNRKLKYKKELFYLLGALLGDGCPYYWKKKDSYMVIVLGEKEFNEKFSEKLFICTTKKVSWCNIINKNVWKLQTSNLELYNLFKEIREDYIKLISLINKGDAKSNSIQFIEGFFDAEGCVKIIKEPNRKTPKICLDICNVDYEILEIIKQLLYNYLSIEANFSIQKADNKKNKQAAFHLRIYKKEFIRIFFNNINTIKLKKEKIDHVYKWLNNGKGS